MPKIICLPENVQFDVAEGESILHAALRADIAHVHVCGGLARCSTCRIHVLEGLQHCTDRTEAEVALATPLRFSPQIRLACQTRVSGDVRLRRLVVDEVDLAIASQLSRQRVGQSGEAKNIAVLFCDIRNFTGLSQLLSPYDLMFTLNRHFFQMADAIERNEGKVEKFIGDAVMAIFGLDDAPLATLRAVKAATEMLAAADAMKAYMKEMYDFDFEIGIGVHFGEAVIGTVRTGREETLAAIGETVSIASRVESANKDAGTRLLISEAAHQEVKGKVEVVDFVRTRLRGTGERLTLHEIARLTEEGEAELAAREGGNVKHFAGRRWTRLCDRDSIADGQREVFELSTFDLVVLRRGERFFAFNNACPHLHAPMFEKRPEQEIGVIKTPTGRELPRDSRCSENFQLVCRWHESRFDLQTGQVYDWCPRLQADGTSKGWEFMGDVSKNRSALKPYPCLVKDGALWVALD